MPRRVVQPVQRLMHEEATGAVVMLGAALVALLWANSAWHGSYERLWSTPFELALGAHIELSLELREVVNDVLMTFFFYLAAVEIKRELVQGELRDPRAAALPAIAAVGGMVTPALLFSLVAAGGPGANGWGIPMATDIAFAVAIVTVAGRRLPATARTFILTLAVVDDIGGIIVIAVFYTSSLSFGWLAVSAGLLAMVGVAQRINIRSYGAYLPLSVGAWYALHESGVHATIAGVVIGLLTPAAAFHDPARFPGWARPLINRIEAAYADRHVTEEEHAGNEAALRDMIRLSIETMSPLRRHQYLAGPWVIYAVVPLFAVANAGVRVLNSGFHNPLTDRVALAPAVGLVAGKAIGVFAASALAVKTRLVRLPRDVTWLMMAGLAATSGVGFTVALFITNLSFDADDITARAKLGVLMGSAVAGMLGWLILRTSIRGPVAPEAADSAPVGAVSATVQATTPG